MCAKPWNDAAGVPALRAQEKRPIDDTFNRAFTEPQTCTLLFFTEKTDRQAEKRPKPVWSS